MTDKRPAWLSFRLSAYYFAVFALVGVAMPYWPVWLQSRGLGPVEIGLVLSVGRWISIGTTPIIAQIADRRGERKRLVILLLTGVAAGYSLYFFADGFWQILAVALIVAVFNSAVNPVGDSLTMLNASRGYTDYGRVRLWGSVSFIITSFLGGVLLGRWGEDAILWVILALAVFTVAVAGILPDTRAEKAQQGKRGVIWRLALHPVMLLFIVAMSLNAGSHAVLYAFGTLNWRDAGISDQIIGLLWAEGVVAEIILFAFGARLIARFGLMPLMALAAIAGVIRWTLLAISSDLAILVVAQALHALTFGAGHLAAMSFVSQAAPAGMSATAQSLYNTLAMGAAIAIAVPLSGIAYERFGDHSYLMMAAMSAAAGVCVWILSRWWNGRRLELPP